MVDIYSLGEVHQHFQLHPFRLSTLPQLYHRNAKQYTNTALYETQTSFTNKNIKYWGLMLRYPLPTDRDRHKHKHTGMLTHI